MSGGGGGTGALEGPAAAVRDHIETHIGWPVRGVQRLGVTAYNQHYRVELDDGPTHLVIYTLPDSLPLQGIRFEHAVVRHLAEAGFEQVPRLVVKDGESLFRVGDVMYALTEWIQGCHVEQERPVNEAELADSARVLAELHRAMRGFEQRLDYFPEHLFVYPASHVLDAYDELLAGLEERVASAAFSDEARTLHARYGPRARRFFEGFDRDAYTAVRQSDPTPVVHGDFRRINLVYRHSASADDVSPDAQVSHVRRVLDYNCCFNEIRLWDVAYAALSFGGKETVGPLRDSPQAAAFIRAYDAASTLSDAEWALLPELLTFVVAKLMLAAAKSWWLTERQGTFERLINGEATRIVALARGDR